MRRVNKTEGGTLLKESLRVARIKILEDLAIDFHELSDGTYFFKTFDDSGLLFDNADEAYGYYYQAYSNDPTTFSVLIPDAERFIADIDSLIAAFVVDIGCAADLDHPTGEIADMIDAAIKREGVSHFLTPLPFQRLAAYIGEIARLKAEGEWGTVSGRESGKDYTLPIIITPAGKKLSAIGKLRKDLFEWNIRRDKMEYFLLAINIELKYMEL